MEFYPPKREMMSKEGDLRSIELSSFPVTS